MAKLTWILFWLTGIPLVQSDAVAQAPAEFSRMALLDDERILKVGDRLSYSVAEDRERNQLIFVNDRGEVDLPLIGGVEAERLTCRSLAIEIKKRLEVDYYYRATVLIDFPNIAANRGEVLVLGEVRQQGPLPIPSDAVLTVSDAILRAGGFISAADRSRVTLIREDANNGNIEERREIDVGAIFDHGDFAADVSLQPGDLILVPQLAEVGGQFYVWGAVNRPGLYTIPNEREFTVSKAVIQAGSFTRFADKKRVQLIRSDASIPEDERTVIVNVADIIEKGIRDFDPVIQADDIIRVKERAVSFGR